MPVSLSEALGKIGPRACAALFYKESEEWLEPASAWLRVGLGKGEKCVIYGDDAFGGEVLAALQTKGVDVGNAMARRALLVLKPDDDAESIVSRLEDQCRIASADRLAGMRLCVDLSPAPGADTSPAEASVDLAAELRTLVASRELQGLFLFRETGFPPASLMGLLRAHPYVLCGGRLLENLHYVHSGEPAAEGPLGEFSQALARLAERHEQVARIRRQAIRLGRLRDITSTLLSKPASPALLTAITESLTALGYRMSWVGMARSNGTVEPVAVAGDLEGHLKSTPVRWDETPLGRGPVGTSIRTGRPDIVHDIRRTPRFAPWKESALAHGFLSVASIPLREAGKVVGALTVYAPTPNAFNPEAVEELSAFAQQASLVLERAKDFRELARSEERLRLLFEQIPAACFTYDRNGLIQQWNLHCRRLYGLSPQEAAGRSLHQTVVPPGRESEAVAAVSRVFSGESVFQLEWEVPGRREGARWVLTNMYPFRGAGGHVELGISVGVDITGQVEARRALAESEQRFRTVVEDANVIVIELDTAGTVRLFNRAAEQVTGWMAEETLGKEFVSFLVPEGMRERSQTLFRAMLAGKEVQGYMGGLLTRSGRERQLSWSGKALRAASGEVRSVVGVGVDITERLRFEEERERIRRDTVRAQKMEAVGSLAGEIAHEYNSVLEAIIGHCSVLQAQMDASHPFAETIHNIQSTAERAADLTAKLLGFARGGKFRVQPVFLNQVVEHVLSVVTQGIEPSLRLERRLDPGLLAVEGDEEQLDHTLLSLCQNARDAMPAGGVLTISTGNAVLDAEEAKRRHVGRAGQYAYVEVRDTGVGMTEEVQKLIFDPFYTTHRDIGRAGMGLSMAYGIVKNHAGGIHAESAPGEGSAFRIYLPAITRLPASIPAAEDDPYPKGTETVLLVDDEPALREMAESMLQALGYRTFVAEDGQAACRLFAERKEEIDLVVLDIIMPKMGGRDTFRELRRMKPGIRVLLSSGYSVEGMVQEILAEGANGFLPKPYGLSQVARAIRKALSGEPTS